MEQTAQSPGTFTPMSQAEFDTALREHELWMRTDGQQGRRGNFRDMDLRGCTLAGASLTGASLRGCCMKGMDLSRTVLQEVDLAEAILSETKAQGTNFQRANLGKAKFDMANLEGADFSFANLQAAELSGANLDRSVLVQTSMREAQLASATLEQANMSQTILREANLTDANLSKANLEHADLRDTRCVRTRFDNAVLKDTMLRGADLEGVSFIEVDFSHAVDVAPQYQMVAFQQRQETLLEEKRQLAQEKQRLAEKEAVVLKEKRDIEVKIGLFNSLKDEEEAFRQHLLSYASKARLFALIWFLAMGFMALIIALVAASIPPDKLNVVEIAVLFSVLLALLALFAVSAALPKKAVKVVDRHVLLRDRKQSLPYNETMDKSDTATQAEPSKPKGRPLFGGKKKEAEPESAQDEAA